MPDSININRNDGPISEEGEGSNQAHVSDHSRSSSLRDPGAAVDTQPQSSESTDILPERKNALEKIRALLDEFEHDKNKEIDEYHQEGQGDETSEPSHKDSVEKQVFYTHIDKLKDLLKELKSLGTKEYVDDVTALAFRASPGPPEVIETLVEAGALVDGAEGENYPLLHHACRYGHTSTVRKIIELRPTSINKPATVWELTPLHMAAMYVQKGVIETLLNADPEINSQDSDGWTPLMAATIEGDVDIMDVLLQRKEIIVDMPDNDGLTPLLMATKGRFFEGVEKLLDANADYNGGPYGGEKCLHWAMWRFSRPIFDRFMQIEGLTIDAQDSEGKTALHYACGSRHQEMREWFIPDWDLSETSANKETTGTEKEKGFIEIIKKLLERKADPLMATKKNKTALNFAFKHRQSDWDELLPIFSIRAERLAPGDWDEEILIHVVFKNRKYDNNEDILSHLMSILSSAPKELDETLQWAAASHSRHEFAKYLFSKHYKEDLDEVKSSWSALRWAIYYRRQELLWWLIATSPRNIVMERQVKAAREIKENEESILTKREKPSDDGFKTEKGAKEGPKPRDDENIWGAIQDILVNPPLAQIYRDTNTLEPPGLSLECERILGEFKSLIVRFYKGRTNSNAIRLSRDVQETIYGTGVTRIMKDETKKLKKILDIGRKGTQLRKQSHKYQTMYDDEKLRFTWVHLPATNMDWMKDLSKRIMIDEKKTGDDFHKVNSFLRDTWFEIPDRESPSRIMRPQFIQRKHSARDNKVKTKSPNMTNESNDKRHSRMPEIQTDQTQKQENKQEQETLEKKIDFEEDFIAVSAVYMPFLSFSTHFQSRTSRTIPDSDEKSEKKNLPSADKDEAIEHSSVKERLFKGLEHAQEQHNRLIDAYKDVVIHRSATLDESYYHFASNESHDDKDSHDDQERRNKEQIVTKLWEWTNNKSAGPDDPWPILRVNQLWVWTINDKWVISATSHPIDDTEKIWVDGFVEYLNKQADAGGVQSQPASAEEMMKVMVDYCIGSYERRRQPAEPGQERQDKPAQQSTDLEHKSHDNSEQKSIDLEHTNHDKPERKSTDLEHKNHDKQEKGEKNLQKHMLSIRQQFSQYINHVGIEETKLFDKFKKLVETQQKSTSGIAKLRKEIFDAHKLFIDVKDIRDELNILKSIAKYQEIVQEKMLGKKHCAELNLPASYVVNDIAEMDKLVERIQSAIQTTLSLQQSEIASLQADEAVSQGKTMMVFTVATILFLPMSFLSSLFALDIEAFQSTPAWVFVVIFLTSILLFIPFAAYTIYHKGIDKLLIKWDIKPGTGSKKEDSRDGKPFSTKSEKSAAESTSSSRSILRYRAKTKDIESGRG